MVPAPDVFVEVAFIRTQPPLRIQQQESAAASLQLLNQLSFGPKLHIISKQHDMDSSFRCLYQFDQCGVSRGGGVDRVGGDPEVVSAAVDHLPHFFEKLVAFGDELGVREFIYDIELQRLDFCGCLAVAAVEGLAEYAVDIHAYNNFSL